MQLQDGDRTAFNEIYRQCSGYIAFVCSKFCSNKEDAEEVVQDTFTIAFKKIDKLRGDTLLAYLRKIAVYESFRKRKAVSRRREYVTTIDELPEDHKELDDNFLPEESLQNKEFRTELLQIISKLPKQQREMIYLYYYVDFGTAEIASLMCCSIDSVYKTLSRARQTIKNKLAGNDTRKAVTVAILALVPLAALLLVEEQAFAKGYIPAVCSAGAMSTATATSASAAQSTLGYTIASCIAIVGIAAVSLYYALQPVTDDGIVYQPYPPYYVTSIPPQANPPPALLLPENTPDDPEVILVTDPVMEPEPATVAEHIPEPTPMPTVTPMPELPLAPAATPIPATTPAPELPLQPTHIDRTAEILAALALARVAEDVTAIINYYGFVFDTQIQVPPSLWMRFYVLDDGSGDILVGMAACEDNGWRMQYEHFNNGQVPLDRTDLFQWMEG